LETILFSVKIYSHSSHKGFYDASKAQALAEKLKQARKAAGLSQVELAQKLGRSQSYVNKVENGHISIDVIELITYCSALGVDPAKLVKSLSG